MSSPLLPSTLDARTQAFPFFPFPRSIAFVPAAARGRSQQATYSSNLAMRTFLSTYSCPEEWRSCSRISQTNT
jgi:hypothetical protein